VTVRSQSFSALLAVAVLIGGLALAGLLATLPFLRLGTLEQTIAQSQSELLELRKEIAREGALRKENTALAASDQDARLLLLEGETTGIAGANLQKLMSGLVLAHGGEATSFQILPPKEDGNLMRIPMGLSIRVGIDGLRDIIHGLETSTPLIFIDDITIRAEQDDFRAPDPHFLGPLDVTLQVSGFAYKHEAS
jgi:general secretion pathway protein M